MGLDPTGEHEGQTGRRVNRPRPALTTHEHVAHAAHENLMRGPAVPATMLSNAERR
jgi:hypothetical protein